MHRAQDFYGKLFGWHIEEGPEEYGGYVMALKDDAPAAALAPTTSGDQLSEWTVYFATDDIGAHARAVQDAGGQVLAGPVEIPGSGHAAYCLDPQGATFGLWQAGEHIGYGIVDEPGAVGWHTLATPDVAAAQQFYGRVLGWSFDDSGVASLSGGARIATIAALDGLLAVAPVWTPVFVVADTASSAQIAQELEGHILHTAGGEWGADAWLEGPASERFRIHSYPDAG